MQRKQFLWQIWVNEISILKNKLDEKGPEGRLWSVISNWCNNFSKNAHWKLSSNGIFNDPLYCTKNLSAPALKKCYFKRMLLIFFSQVWNMFSCKLPTLTTSCAKVIEDMAMKPEPTVYFIFWLVSFKHCKSCRPKVFCKKVFLKNFAKFRERRLCQSLLFNKVGSLMSANLLKKRLRHFFSCDFC